MTCAFSMSSVFFFKKRKNRNNSPLLVYSSDSQSLLRGPMVVREICSSGPPIHMLISILCFEEHLNTLSGPHTWKVWEPLVYRDIFRSTSMNPECIRYVGIELFIYFLKYNKQAQNRIFINKFSCISLFIILLNIFDPKFFSKNIEHSFSLR